MGINEVKVNGEVVMSTRGDTVSEDNLFENETATNSAGNKIVGSATSGGSSNYYSTSDPEGLLDEVDYIPFYDTEDNVQPKKKTLFSNFINRLRSVFAEITGSNINDPNTFRSNINTVDQVGVAITSGSDLDDYMTAGTYSIATDTIASNIGNLPLEQCGKVIVFNNSNSGLEQFYLPNHSSRMFVRSYWQDAWLSWKELAKMDDLDEIQRPYYGVGTISGSAITSTISGFKLKSGAIVSLKFSSELPENATLNISSTGAKDIFYYNDNKIRNADRYGGAGVYTFIYDGTQYRVIAINNVPHVSTNSYVANTSGSIVETVGYDQNVYQMKYYVSDGVLKWNFYKDNVWRGDVDIIDNNLLQKRTHYLSQPSSQITANQDLDDFTESGTYQCNNSNIAVTLSNCPVKCSFKLVVDRAYTWSASEITQRIVCQNKNDMGYTDWIRVRPYSLSTWGKWSNLVYSRNESWTIDGNAVNGVYFDVMGAGGERGFVTFNKIANHLRHNYYNGSSWGTEKTIANLDDVITQKGIEIPENADLNTYTTVGNYQCFLSATARTISNLPITGDERIAFKLIVMYLRGTNNIAQIYIPYMVTNQNSNHIFIRTSDNTGSSWNSWRQFSFSNDIDVILQNKTQWLYGAVDTNHKITRTDDLNNFTAAGTYQYDHDNNGLPANCPFTQIHSFKLIVDRYSDDSRSEIMQRITMQNVHYDANAVMDWYRVRIWNRENWESWKQVASTDDIQSYTGSGYAVASVSGSAITATISGFVLAAGKMVVLKCDFALPINATLNISNTGAKSIYWFGGSGIRSEDMPRFGADIYTVVYDGSVYRIVAYARVPKIELQSYVANTSGSVVLSIGAEQNAYQIKYNLGSNKLLWNYIRSGSWRGDVKLADYDDLITTGLTTVPSNVDFNDYKECGVYSVLYDATAQTITNIPVQLSGKLIVVGNTDTTTSNLWKTQIYLPNHESAMYLRSSSSDTNGQYWLPWTKLGGTAGGYLPLTGGTVTGEINYKRNDIDAQQSNNGVTSDAYHTYNFKDKNNLSVGLLHTVIKPNGNIGIYLQARNYNGSTTAVAMKAFGIIIDKSGNLVYDFNDGQNANTALGYGYGVCDTAESTTAKTVSISNYNLVTHGVVFIKFTNKVPASATLNINSKGAKAIYYRGSAITANIILAGDTVALVYDGTQYDVIAIDRTSTAMGNYLPLSGGTLTGILNLSGTDLALRTSSSSSDDSSDIVWYHGNGQEKARIWTADEYVKATGLSYRLYKKDGTQLFSGRIPLTNTYVGTCDTAAGTKDKVATTTDDFALVKGIRVAIKYTYTNSYNSTSASPITLNVNSTGAKSIYYDVGVATGTSDLIFGYANKYIYYVYDGTYWVWDGAGNDANSKNFLRNDASSTLTASSPFLDLKASNIDITAADNGVSSTQYPAYIIQDKNGKDMSRLETVVEANGQIRAYLQACNYKTSNSTHFRAGITIYTDKSQDVWYDFYNPHRINVATGNGFATDSRSSAVAAVTANLTRYVLASNGVVVVKFAYDVPANATLNINSRGAKNIYYHGSAITAGRIIGGDYATFMYDGVQYNLLGVDRAASELRFSQTLTAGTTSVTFTGLPTSGINLIDIYTSKAGLNYTAIDDSTSGQLVLTYPVQSNNVTVYLKIETS